MMSRTQMKQQLMRQQMEEQEAKERQQKAKRLSQTVVPNQQQVTPQEVGQKQKPIQILTQPTVIVSSQPLQVSLFIIIWKIRTSVR